MSSNNSNTQETTFWKFLTDYTIEIPIIQRDYAQGRLGKEFLRKSFLTDLKNALDSSNSQEKMKLDFVYGSVENGKLSPLDGQQRLTTLWLLHWYIALMSGNLNEKVCKTLAKFTYETRISSREFCENLCKLENFSTFNDFKSTEKRRIVDYIISRTWFYSAWKQDPTIQSMLRMLGGTEINDKNGEDIVDGLEEVFQKCNKEVFENYWEILISENAPIVFYHLQLKGFGRSDDLYIKMNARGKQLTSFENFKADLVGYIREKSWNDLLDAKDGIPIKMDTTWTDIFWKNRSYDNRIDEIYFAFLNRFFFNELICLKDAKDEFKFSGEILEKDNGSFLYLYGNKGDDSNIKYADFKKYKYSNEEIPSNIFESLKNVLGNYKTDIDINSLFPKWVKTDFQFIPAYQDNTISTLGQKERVVFLAIARYLEKGDFENKSFKQWMRVVWNIVENANIETIAAMIGAMRLIDELSIHSHDIYTYLAENNEINSNAAKVQVAEERAKAKQILKDNLKLRDNNGGCKKKDSKDYNTWESKIIEAEKYAFFKGAIRFLFTDEEGEVNWDNFDTKWGKAKEYFDEEGVRENYRKTAILLRALLSRIDISEQWFGNYKGFWLDALCDKKNSKAIDEILTINSLTIDNSCQEDWIKDDFLLPALMEKYDDWHILKNWNGYDTLTRYSVRRSDATSKDQIVVFNKLRNKLLGDAEHNINCKEFRVSNSNCKYLYGLNIDFKYNNEYHFRWYGSPNDKELDVYLMEDKWADYKKRTNSTTDNKGTDEDRYFCFSVTDEMEQDNSLFTNQLDCLIIQAYLDADKSVCEKCKEKDCAQNLEK